MRLLIFVPALALGLAACGKSDGTEERNADRVMTAEAITSNDVTAIDAVTGEAANMAADVDITRELNATVNGIAPAKSGAGRRPAGAGAPSPRPTAGPTAPAEQPEAPAEPESNVAQ